jgi:hypothetical protein
MSSNGLALSRRDLLRTVAAGAAALALPIGAMKAQAKRGRIDVHHHMLPAFIDLWLAQVVAAGFDRGDG